MKTKPKKVFEYEPSVPYSFGHVLIAANNKDEADKLMLKSVYCDYLEIKFSQEVPKLKFFGKSQIVMNNASCE